MRIRSNFLAAAALLILPGVVTAQTLINIDFGVGSASPKSGMAATGMGTNDFWNLYRHYDPKFTAGSALVFNGKLEKLKYSDHGESKVSITVNNAPGVWGNASGDPMFDSYIFSQNGSNMVATVSGLPAGRYHFYLYGHAEADVTGEQNSIFTLRTGTNSLGPVAQTGGTGWRAGQPWQERAQYVVIRDVPVDGQPVIIEVGPGANGVAVLNGLQIISRGTSPPRLLAAPTIQSAPVSTNLSFREIHYEGEVSDTEARFACSFTVESFTTNEISAPLFEGDVALISPELPEGLRIVSQEGRTWLFCKKPGTHPVKLVVVAKIARMEPWNQISFTGPPAAIASVTAKAAGTGVEMQLLSGTQLEPEKRATSQVSGFLGGDRALTLRWQSRAAEISRKSLVTVDTTATVQITPTVMKFTTALRYEILQAAIPRVRIALPPAHALTRIEGEQIRDWQVKAEGEQQVLTVEFIKPVEKSASLTLFSEQTVETTPFSASLAPPQPLDVEREAGSFSLSADDATVEIESAPGLRQVNAAAGALAAYRFNSRPVMVHAKLQRIEPVLKLADRVTARLEENRLLVSHALTVNVEKAGIYTLDITPPSGFVVSEVKGEGVDDWKVSAAKLKISFASRVLGSRKIQVQLEQAHKDVPPQITITPLRVAGATNLITHLGAASSPGIQLKTAEGQGLREIPITSLPERSDELLAFRGEQPDWKLTLAAEKLSARVVAEVFNLVTIGDGLAGGSATIRYGILNQGVQQFRIALPGHWKNVEFIGANIRRKETASNVWTITLQDKAWGGYTLVLTYDYQFDPKGAKLDLAGAHPLDIERETGSLGIMTAASLKVTPEVPIAPLRRVDEAELSESDRALCTRPLLLAYKYTGSNYQYAIQVSRFEEVPVLSAVADRIELTTVLTEEGQLLTQASFMVKNNEKQFERFKLPADATFWSSYVNGQPTKPEKDGEWLLVPLPRDANRDQAFAMDIVFAQKINLKASLFPRRVELFAPLTDVPNTYAEWQLFAPVTERLTGFSGNMTVAQGTTYEFRDAWHGFLQFYGDVIEHHLGFVGFCLVAGVVVLLIVSMLRRGAKGALEVIVVLAILAVLAAMLLPALSKAKARAQRINAVNNLKQIGLAARTWCLDNNGSALPPSLDAMKNELGSDKVLIDPNTGQPFVYVGQGKSETTPEAIIAYSPSDVNGRAVLFADGSVQQMSAEKFQEALQRDAAVPRAVISANAPAQGMLTPLPSVTAAPASEIAGNKSEPVARESLTRSFGIEGQPRGFARRGPSDQPAMDPATGLPVAPPIQPQAPTVAGVRPIRIDVPRTGQAFSFTKVLNVGQEPLKVSVSMMRLKVYRAVQMTLQVCAFLVGLFMLWWLALQPQRSSLRLAIAAALVLWAVSRLLTMWRVLHVGLIVAVPLVIFGLMAWGIYGYWRHRKARRSITDADEPPTIPPNAGSAPAAVLILLTIAIGSFAGSLRAEDEKRPSLTNTVSLVSAVYSGAVSEKVARFNASLQVLATATNQIVPLFGDDVAIESFSGDGEARLIRSEHGVGVLVPGSGKVALQFKLLARLGGDVSRRQLAFGIPAALSSRVTLVIDEAEADVEFPSALSFQRKSENQQTRVEGVIGSGGRLELNWTPRVKRAAEIAATVFVQNTAVATLGGGVMSTRATLHYQVSQGELKQLRLQIPKTQRLLRVEGEFIRTWELKEDTLAVELLKGVAPAYDLTIETEKILDKLPATLVVEIPHALDVKRETGLVGLRGSEELAVVVEESSELQRVDAEEFHRAAPDRKEGLLSAFRFLKTDFALRVRAEVVQAQLEAEVFHRARINSDSLRVTSQINYTIKRAGVFALRLALPDGFKLESVTGTNVSQWLERSDNGAKILEVTLKQRTTGAYRLDVELSQTYTELPGRLTIAGVHPLGVEKLSGFVTLSAEVGVAAKTESFEGLTEIPFASVPGASSQGSSSALAYKFIAATPGAAAAWVLRVSTESVQPWVRAEVANIITLTETLISGRALVKYDIANGPVKEFRLRVPAEFKNVEINGAQIRRRDETNGEWRVELQGKVRGDYLLTVTWEMPRTGSTNLVELRGIEAAGVERETGFLALVARPPLQVSQKSAGDLLTAIDARELPEWAGAPDSATVLAYRYVRPGYKLILEARRFDEAEVLQTLIDSARITTVVADDGQTMTELSLSVRNNGRQHLEVELPTGATVWSAFIGGEPIRPGNREGKLLLPLTREVASDAPIAIELTYVNSDKFPKHSGTVSLASPKFDVPLKNAHWDLYLPPDYEYSRFAGSMNRTSDANLPLVQVYSLSEYNVQEKAQQEQIVTELKSDLSDVKKNLKGANLRQAMSSYNRAKSKGQEYRKLAEGEKDLKEVEQQLRQAQGSNLIIAQNNFYNGNLGRQSDANAEVNFSVGGGQAQQGGQSKQMLLNGDNDVASQQWDKLEKAQQVATTKVAPLRVNLPTRGVHLGFVQVLQTEIRKPVTIRLFAENTKVPSWTSRIGWLVLGFLALWACMAFLNRKTQRI